MRRRGCVRRSAGATGAALVLGVALAGCAGSGTAASGPDAPPPDAGAISRSPDAVPTSALDFIVLDAEGNPVAGIDVSIEGTTRRSGADGTLRFDALPPGDHFVCATAGPVRPALMKVVRTPLTGTVPIVIGGLATLTGRITRVGTARPVGGWPVTVSMYSHAFWFPDIGTVATGSDGTWSARVFAHRGIRGISTYGLPDDAAAPDTSDLHPGEVRRIDFAVDDTSPPPQLSEEQRLALSRAAAEARPLVRFHGRVSGTGGRRAWVQARLGDPRFVNPWAGREWHATGEDGTFDFGAHVDPSGARVAQVRAWCPGRPLTVSAASGVSAEATEVAIEFDLTDGRTIEGRITGESGLPIGGALVAIEDPELRSLGEDTPEYPPTVRAISSADGTFRIEHLEPKWTRVEVSAPGHVTATWVLTHDLEPARLDVKLHPATVLRGRIVHDDGTPAARAQLEVFVGADVDLPQPVRLPDASESSREEDEAAELAAHAAADASAAAQDAADEERRRHETPLIEDARADGTFEAAGVAADGWTLRISPALGDDGASPRFFVHRVRGTTAPRGPFEIVIPRAPRITGRVEAPGGGVVANAFVTVHEPEDHGRAFVLVRTDAEGRFDVPSPGAGPLRIDVKPRNGRETEFGGVAPGAKDLVLRLPSKR